MENIQKEKRTVFYSKNWKLDALSWNGTTFVDIMVDEVYFYLIKLPVTQALKSKLKWIFLSNLLHRSKAYALDNIEREEEFKKIRSEWLEGDTLISEKYRDYIFCKIPRSELRDAASFNSRSFKVFFEGKKITLLNWITDLTLRDFGFLDPSVTFNRANDDEFERLRRYLADVSTEELVKRETKSECSVEIIDTE
ncbi:MAG: hypothetical protein AAB682_01470 [Patescibacteria group bacterium]